MSDQETIRKIPVRAVQTSTGHALDKLGALCIPPAYRRGVSKDAEPDFLTGVQIESDSSFRKRILAKGELK